MTAATLAASAAILKTRYPTGKLPLEVYKNFKSTSMTKKREDFTGENRVVALQNESPQGSSADFATALGSLAQGVYNKFTVTRKEHFGIARIKGQALRAAQGDEGALVDLWKNECDGISRTEMQNFEIYSFGNGSGVLGQVASGQATATVTLAVPSDAAKFALNMRVQAVSNATLSPTLQNGTATITGIDRLNGTLTVATTWQGVIPTLAANMWLVRAGDYAQAGTPRVIAGNRLWIAGGTTPGTLFGLDRNADPTRLAGQVQSVTGLPMEEAAIELSALVNQQGAPQPKLGYCHPRDLANFKKQLGSKVTYPKATVSSSEAGVSFSGIEVEGDEDRIVLLTTPFITRGEFHLIYEESWTNDTLGPVVHMLDYDQQNFLRVSNDDAYEVRFGTYGERECNMPFANIIGTGFGAV